MFFVFISIFAAPTAVLSDRGSEFLSGLFTDYLVNESPCNKY